MPGVKELKVKSKLTGKLQALDNKMQQSGMNIAAYKHPNPPVTDDRQVIIDNNWNDVNQLTEQERTATNNSIIAGLRYSYHKHLEELNEMIARFYQLNVNGVYRTLNAMDIKMIKEKYEYALIAIQSLKDNYIKTLTAPGLPAPDLKEFTDIEKILTDDIKIIVNLRADDRLSLPAAVYKLDKEVRKNHYLNGQKKEPGFSEYCDAYIQSTLTTEELFEKYINMSPQQLKDDFQKRFEDNPNLYEYKDYSSKMSLKLMNTGNIEQIDEYLNNPDNAKIPYAEKKYLLSHKHATEKANQIKQEAMVKMNNNQPTSNPVRFKKLGQNVAELDIHLTKLQSSSQGCWSCAIELMLRAKGYNVSQEEVRAHRPNLGEEDVVQPQDQLDREYRFDSSKNLLMMGDSALSFAPNTMLNELTISPYTRSKEMNNISGAEYVNETVEMIRKTVLHAIKDDKSPVAMLLPGHYVTIIGIDGDIIKYKDSRDLSVGGVNGPDYTYTKSLKDLVRELFLDKPENRRIAMELTWLSDIKLCKDGKTIHGVPSVYVEANNDGTIKLPPEDIQEQADYDNFATNRDGYRFGRNNLGEGGDRNDNKGREDRVLDFGHKVYMPKRLNINYLKTQATNRDIKEEEELNRYDKDFLGLDYPRNVQKAVKEDEEFEIIDEESEITDASKKVSNNRLRTISQEVNVLYGNLKNTSTISTSVKPAYGQLMNSLIRIKQLSDLGVRNLPHDNNIFSLQELNELLIEINQSINSCVEYLDAKYNEIAADPKRRLDPKKQKLEQRRIRNVLKSYEKLLEIKSKLNSCKKMEIAENKARIQAYRRVLVNDLGDVNAQQKASFKYRIKMNKNQMKKMERVHAVFGKFLQGLDIFKEQKVFKLNTRKNLVNRDMPNVNDNLRAIGSNAVIDKLSANDFCALSFAAAGSQRSYNVYIEKHKIPGVDNETHFKSSGHTICEFLLKDKMSSGNEFLPAIKNARTYAERVVNDYGNGNKTPLANLIKDGINNLANFSKHNTAKDSEVYLYYSEMGQRLVFMLERDPELMKIAERNGLDVSNISYLRAMEAEGRIASKAKVERAKLDNIISGEDEELSMEEREEIYTDILMDVMLKESRKSTYKNMTERDDYKTEKKRIEDQIKLDRHKIEEKFKKEVTKLYARDGEYQRIREEYNNALNEAKGIKDEEVKENRIVVLEHDFYDKVVAFHNRASARLLEYTERLREKYKAGKDETQKKLLERAKKDIDDTSFDIDTRDQTAIKLQELQSYMNIVDSSKFDQVNLERLVAVNYLPQKRIAQLDALNVRMAGRNSTIEDLAKPGNELNQRKRIKKYLEVKGYLEYDAQEFINNVVTKGPNSERKNDIKAEIAFVDSIPANAHGNIHGHDDSLDGYYNDLNQSFKSNLIEEENDNNEKEMHENHEKPEGAEEEDELNKSSISMKLPTRKRRDSFSSIKSVDSNKTVVKKTGRKMPEEKKTEGKKTEGKKNEGNKSNTDDKKSKGKSMK